MDKKYWVPALEKANHVLQTIAEEPSALKLIDISKKLGINKSSLFSLLATMEALEWVVREKDATYSLGSKLGLLGNVFFKQFTLIDRFKKEASVTKHVIQETIQLAKLEQHEVLYLAKEEMPSQVKLTSEPGMKLPAHSTALGKALLAWLPEQELPERFPQEMLEPLLTPYTVKTRQELVEHLNQVRESGFAFDLQEAVVGFCCVAAPVRNAQGEVIAAISCSMFQHVWEQKKELAQKEICDLAARLSHY
jgi:DNA-binding IclR family transcriptional regulator